MDWKAPGTEGVYFPDSISEGVYLCHINGAFDEAYSSALVNDGGDYQVRGTFTDLWYDNFFLDESGNKINLSTLKINPNDGFTITYNVQRTTYKGRLSDIIDFEIDCFTADYNPIKVKSYTFAVDALTYPNGSTTTPLPNTKPLIGYVANNNTTFDLTDIKFVDHEIGQEADVSRFNLRSVDIGDPGTYSIDSKTQSITFNGKFGSSYLVTDQFDTFLPEYDFSMHVEKPGDRFSEEQTFGLCLYVNAKTWITFYLDWKENVADTIAEMDYLCCVDGNDENAYQSAAIPGDFSTRTLFTDLWSDSSFSRTLQGDNFNLRGNTYIELKDGVDVSFHIKRGIYQNRASDIIHAKINALDNSGNIITVYSKQYAVDALTNPLGTGESKYQGVRPQIGFTTNQSNVTISNIKFTAPSDTTKSDILSVGTGATVSTDYTNDLVHIENHNVNYGGAILNGLAIDSQDFDLEATIYGNGDNSNNNSVGFTLFYDELNYAKFYFNWNDNIGTIYSYASLYVLNGVPVPTYLNPSVLNNPWDITNQYENVSPWYFNYSDFGGWVTDACIANSEDANFNRFRDELPNITLSDGLHVRLQKSRIVRNGILYDEVSTYLQARDVNNNIKSWQTTLMDYTIFTTNEATRDLIPQIGLFVYSEEGVQLNATYGNMKLNGDVIDIDGPSIEVINPTTTFNRNDPFTFGGTVNLVYGESKRVQLNSTQYTVDSSNVNMAVAGTYTVNVIYNANPNITTSYTITVNKLIFTVTFDLNGGSGTAPDQHVVEGDTAVQPENPTKSTGFFIGWFNGNVQFDFATPITSNLILTAHYLDKVIDETLVTPESQLFFNYEVDSKGNIVSVGSNIEIYLRIAATVSQEAIAHYQTGYSYGFMLIDSSLLNEKTIKEYYLECGSIEEFKNSGGKTAQYSTLPGTNPLGEYEFGAILTINLSKEELNKNYTVVWYAMNQATNQIEMSQTQLSISAASTATEYLDIVEGNQKAAIQYILAIANN